jgi:hypothetical protein
MTSSQPSTKIYEERARGELERFLIQREVNQCVEVLYILPYKVFPSQVISLTTFNFLSLSVAEVGTGELPLSITGRAAPPPPLPLKPPPCPPPEHCPPTTRRLRLRT